MASCSGTFPPKAFSPKMDQISSLLLYKLQRGCLAPFWPVLGFRMRPSLWNVRMPAPPCLHSWVLS